MQNFSVHVNLAHRYKLFLLTWTEFTSLIFCKIFINILLKHGNTFYMINIAIIHLLLSSAAARNEKICFTVLSTNVYADCKQERSIKRLHRNYFPTLIASFSTNNELHRIRSQNFSTLLFSHTHPFAPRSLSRKELKEWKCSSCKRLAFADACILWAGSSVEGEIWRIVSLNFTVHTKHALAFCWI